MSMLAQGRRRQKISTNPNGLLFSSDDSNIGQKLMSQMGWEKGKGLGANEQGEKDPIKVKMNIESRGLGCKRSDVDKWIDHQDDFNSLLANLNEKTEAESQPEPEVRAVQSLEAKSKSSRSRVHYMKFTKGKDLSRHSDKEMACILGPRRSANSTPLASIPNSTANSDDSNEGGKLAAGDGSDPFLSDARHVTSTLSLQEYFASKMAAKKSSSSNLLREMVNKTPSPAGPVSDDQQTDEDVEKPSFFIGDSAEQEEADETPAVKRQKGGKGQRAEEVENDEIQQDLYEQKRAKRKLKKRLRREKREAEEARESARHRSGGKTRPKPADDTMKFVSESSDSDGDDKQSGGKTSATAENSGKSKKSSKRKRPTDENAPDIRGAGETTTSSSSDAVTVTRKIRKSKSDSHLLVTSSNKVDEETDSKPPKKKKSKKNKYKEV